MGVFDGSVYRIRARKGDHFSESHWAQDDSQAIKWAEGFKTLGWDAVEADEVFYAAHGNDRLGLSFGDYWGDEEEAE
ncbi:hypothetical protein [Streptomyces sp. NPDC006355]|uniref:hypothetical protein n=1 Tax=Streptomyces sp. NPDC006355 TaxID=3156758 RepID=UPI0033A6ADD0